MVENQPLSEGTLCNGYQITSAVDRISMREEALRVLRSLRI